MCSLDITFVENRGSSLFLSVLLLWGCFVLLFLEDRVMCAIPDSRSTQSCRREATGTIPILLKTLISRRGPQKVNWQLCLKSMPIEDWDSSHSFSLFLLDLLGVNTIEFGLQSCLSTAIENTFIRLSVRSSLYTGVWVQAHQSSSLKI